MAKKKIYIGLSDDDIDKMRLPQHVNCRCNIDIKPKNLFRVSKRPIEVDPQNSLYTQLWGLKTPETDSEHRQSLREKWSAIEDLKSMGFEADVMIIGTDEDNLFLMIRKPKINFIK